MSNCPHEMCTVAVAGALCLGIVCLSILAFIYFKQAKERDAAVLRMNEYAINVQAIIDDSIPEILNGIIDECFTDYKLLVLFPKNEAYLTEEREREIRQDLAAKVTERLSPMAIDKLSLRYNVANIGAIIADKIYIVVMNYVIEHNATLEEK